MYNLRKYHGDKIQSLTYEGSDSNFSVGIISPGEFHFGSIIMEDYTITSGKISVWKDDGKGWSTYGKDKKFVIEKYIDFKLKTEVISSYICFYL